MREIDEGGRTLPFILGLQGINVNENKSGLFVTCKYYLTYKQLLFDQYRERCERLAHRLVRRVDNHLFIAYLFVDAWFIYKQYSKRRAAPYGPATTRLAPIASHCCPRIQWTCHHQQSLPPHGLILGNIRLARNNYRHL